MQRPSLGTTEAAGLLGWSLLMGKGRLHLPAPAHGRCSPHVAQPKKTSVLMPATAHSPALNSSAISLSPQTWAGVVVGQI